MRRLLITAAAAALMVSAAYAQPGNKAGGSSSDSSGVDFSISHYGQFGYDAEHNKPGFIVPRGSGVSYLFGSGIWFGGKKKVGNDLKKMTFLTYNPNSGASWATPGPFDDSEQDFAYFNSLDYDEFGHWNSLTTPVTQDWPLWVLPGTTVTPLSPGVYEPMQSRRNTDGGRYAKAAFMPGVYKQIVSRYNDKSVARYEVADPMELVGYPFGIQVRQEAYAWNKGLYANTVVLQYEVVNKSQDTLFDCVIGQASDPDIGTSSNDNFTFVKDLPELRTALAWSAKEATPFQTLVMSVIEAPQAGAGGRVDNSNRLGYYLNGRVGSCPAWTINIDPRTSAERYDFMRSGTFADNIGGNDVRAMMASNAFTMYPGDTAHFAVLFAVAPVVRNGSDRKDSRSIASVDLGPVEQMIHSVFQDYYGATGFHSNLISSVAGGARVAERLLTAAPNPASDHATVSFSLSGESSVNVRIVDRLGRTVLDTPAGALSAGPHEVPVDVRTLPTGIYFVIIDGASATNATPLTIVR